MGKVTLPFVGMVMAECAQVALIILSKQVMAKGMSNFIFIFYSNTLAALVLLPCSFLLHRLERPRITFPTLCEFFLLGLLGYLAQAFGYAGIYYSSATLSTAMLNLVPGFTFLLAVVFRMEQLDWRSSSFLAKSLGTIVSITGAFIATLYRGLPLLMGLSPPNTSQQQVFSQESNWVLGGLFLAADCVMASAYIILQSAMTCLVVERDISAWSLEPKLRLLVVLYSGIFGSAFQVGVISWCLHQTGPVFVSMFKPLGIVISVVVGVIFLGDAFYLGSLIGATVIVVGFYSVLWGKAKDIEDIGVRSSASKGKRTPLLKENSSE